MDKKSWFSIKAKSGNKKDSVDIYIFDDIGYWDISAREFIQQLKKIDVKQINLHINSPGGSVFDGIAIQNSLKHHKAEITVWIDGLAASIASIIALAGDQIQIADNAYVMIHNPASSVYSGEAKDMLKEADLLNKIADGLAGDYSRKMGIAVEEARSLMDDETWYLGQEAVDAGFADGMFPGSLATASFNSDRFSSKTPEDVLKRFTKTIADKTTNTKKKEAVIMSPEKKDKQEVESNEDAATVEETEETESTETTEIDTNSGVEEAVQNALKTDRKRTSEIAEIGDKFGFIAGAKEFSETGKSVNDFRAFILNKSPEDWEASLKIKNPAQQESAKDIENATEGTEAVTKIKERRKSSFGSK